MNKKYCDLASDAYYDIVLTVTQANKQVKRFDESISATDGIAQGVRVSHLMAGSAGYLRILNHQHPAD